MTAPRPGAHQQARWIPAGVLATVRTWHADAACNDPDVNPEWFADHNSGDADQIVKAKTVCARCPVIDHCLSWALSAREKYGTWGGMTAAERRRYLRTNRRTAA